MAHDIAEAFRIWRDQCEGAHVAGLALDRDCGSRLDRPGNDEICTVTQGDYAEFSQVQVPSVMPVNQEEVAGLQILKQLGPLVGGQGSARVLSLPAEVHAENGVAQSL